MVNPVVRLGHQVLRIDYVYDFYQNLVGGVKYRDKFVKGIIDTPDSAVNVIDLGSGTSEIAKVLKPSQNYIGLDNSQEYLNKATRRRFSCSSFKVFNYDLSSAGWSDLVKPQFTTKNSINAMALGLLHHLNDAAVNTLLQEVQKTFRDGGSIHTVDPIITEDSTPIARWFAKNDRGQFVRSEEHLKDIFEKNGFKTQIRIMKKQFRIPLDTIEITAIPK